MLATPFVIVPTPSTPHPPPTTPSSQEAAGEDKRIVRVMPNTPCLVGETAAAMCLGGVATEADAELV